MFRLQVWCQRKWQWGLNTYNTMEEADKRLQELARVGIKARVKPLAELFE